MVKARWLRLLAGVFALSLVLAACGGDDEGGDDTGGGGGETAETGGGGGGTSITIADFAFDPNTISVSGPTEVTITNDDSAAHLHARRRERRPGDRGGRVRHGDRRRHGEHGLRLRFHPQMTGTVEVA